MNGSALPEEDEGEATPEGCAAAGVTGEHVVGNKADSSSATIISSTEHTLVYGYACRRARGVSVREVRGAKAPSWNETKFRLIYARRLRARN